MDEVIFMKGEQTMAIKLKKETTFLHISKLRHLVFTIQTKILMETVLCPQLLSDDLNESCHQLTSQIDSKQWEDMLPTLASLDDWLEGEKVVLHFKSYNEPGEKSEIEILHEQINISTAEIQKRIAWDKNQ